MPAVPYVPGATPRPEEGAYDALRVTARPGMSVCDLADSDAWTAGWAFLEAECFWEAHEVWEAVWLVLPPNSAERRFVQAVIQLANALLKEKMDRPQAVRRLCVDCRAGLNGASTEVMGIRVASVLERLDALEARIEGDDAL
nr:DUF309 domain-containing protein [Tropicibacter sp. R16_0]